MKNASLPKTLACDGSNFSLLFSNCSDNRSTGTALTFYRRQALFFTVDMISMWIQTISIVLSLVSNSLVIYVLKKRRRLKTQGLTISYLAGCDLMYSVLQIFLAHRRFAKHEWHFGDIMCKLSTMSPCAIIASVFTIAFIAVERQHGVNSPLKVRIQKVKTTFIVVMIWCSSLLLLLPSAIHMKAIDYDGKKDCMRIWNSKVARYWDLTVFICTYPIPLLIILVSYYRVIFEVRRRSKETQLKINRRREHRIREQRKMMIMIMIIFIALLVTTSPNQAFIIWISFAPKNGPNLHETFLILYSLSSLVHLHSFLNPIIYSIADPGFRKFFCENRRKNNSQRTEIISSINIKSKNRPIP